MNDKRSPKERMREAAASLLIEQGPAAITHRKVAAAAGVPQGSANHWYPSKETLFRDAVRSAEQLRNREGARFAKNLEQASRTPEEISELLIRVWYAPHVGSDVISARLEPMLEAARSPEFRELMSDSRAERLESLRVVFSSSGYEPPEDLDLVALVLDATLLYSGSSGDTDPFSSAIDALTRFLRVISNQTESANPS